jgi:hypothetical protein
MEEVTEDSEAGLLKMLALNPRDVRLVLTCVVGGSVFARLCARR